MNILEKLLCIQIELKAPKNQYNDFGEYHYRNCEDILEAVKPICKKYGAVLVLRDKLAVVNERYYVEATATLYNCEKTDENISASAYAREDEKKAKMDGSQVTGSSSSYARKYALNGLFNIDDTKDGDGTNKGAERQEQPKKDYCCSVCGKPISKNYYERSIEKYGSAFCSAACKEAADA